MGGGNYGSSQGSGSSSGTNMVVGDGSESNPIQISTINSDMEGKCYPGTNVMYERKKVLVNGEYIEGVFPQFESAFDTTIPEELYLESDYTQDKYCVQQLQKALRANPELEKKFTKKQLKAIYSGEEKIPDYIWHHTEVPGKFQLVKSKIHRKCRHTGGRKIWGGGSDNR